MRISDWRSDVCSSDLPTRPAPESPGHGPPRTAGAAPRATTAFPSAPRVLWPAAQGLGVRLPRRPPSPGEKLVQQGAAAVPRNLCLHQWVVQLKRKIVGLGKRG